MRDSPATQTCADLLISCLEANGVTAAFGVPGEETTELVSAIDRSGIDFVLCRHEQSAAFMASVHGRLTGNPALCIATLGPGATNLVTGVADATLDHVPMIAITGQGARDQLGRESHQIIDLESLFVPITKFSRTLVLADEIPQVVAEAARHCNADKPGAVHLSLPEDLAGVPTTAEPFVASPPAETRPATDAVVRAARLVSQSKEPVILAGHGVIRANAAELVRDLSEKLSAPVLTTFMAKGILAPDHPLCLHTIGQPGEELASKAFELSDLVIAIGFDPVEYPPAKVTLSGMRPVLEISDVASTVDVNWPVKAALTGDLLQSIGALHKATAQRELQTAFEDLRRKINETLEQGATTSKGKCLTPSDICKEISNTLRDSDVLLSGVGLHKLWIARNVQAKRAGQIIIPNGLAGMGLALPGAIEAARQLETGRVIAVCGDGDFLMNVQEMETATRLCVPVTVLVWEDNGYGLIDEKQPGDREFAFRNPDWASLAQAFGWVYHDIDTPAKLGPALQAAADIAVPTLLRVPVDYAAEGGMPAARD
ncbi:acetolactate synthase large subunit [Ruegeria atlantica]|uniref:Acetolactate synthase large subunit n=1 Tax=Ruegeria atlantica TaxID=81569 RepID=A0AA90Z0T0_9RHOB|nr:acetolactate synthase large subunit [Ruegeria atlantica]NOE20808.1 acetolactate synthase large subunit [Ruegeria atlantica]